MYQKDEIIKKGLSFYLKNQNYQFSVVDLAKEFNISKVTIYNYFHSKKEFQAEVVSYILNESKQSLFNLSASKLSTYKKISMFMYIMTNLYSSQDYVLIEHLVINNPFALNVINEFNKNYQDVLLLLIEEGQEKGKINKKEDPLFYFYLVDMGFTYFKESPKYRENMKTNARLRDFIMDTYISKIFTDTSSINTYSRNIEKQKKDNIIEYYMELAEIGTKKAVDTMMKELDDSKTVVETRFIDFGLSLVDASEGCERIKWFLFNGTQIQRNYATLYFIRQGRYDYIKEAFDLGLIDEKQAFSR